MQLNFDILAHKSTGIKTNSRLPYTVHNAFSKKGLKFCMFKSFCKAKFV